MYPASDEFPKRMAGSAPDRMALLERWRQHLKDAKMRYAFAKNYAKEVMEDFRSGGISATTEMFACQKAIRAEVFALREYDRALRIVTDLALNGKVPVEDDPPKYAKID